MDVSGEMLVQGDGAAARWSRFAPGFCERVLVPLGRGLVFVRGKGRWVLLHEWEKHGVVDLYKNRAGAKDGRFFVPARFDF